MSFMFYYCTENMEGIFYECIKFNQKINFDTRNAINMANMIGEFYNFNNEINIDTTNIEYDNLFEYLTTI